MGETTDRDSALAATFERVAADLREGSATVYGYDVRLDPPLRERGGIAYSNGWLSFEVVEAGDSEPESESESAWPGEAR